MRTLTSLLTALITAGGLAVAIAPDASALGGESLVCRVGPSRTAAFNPSCSNNMPATSYGVTFWVQNETAPSTYAWSITSDLRWTVSSGCTSTSNNCTITVPNADNDITASVTLTQNGASETLTSYAFVGQYCGTIYCA